MVKSEVPFSTELPEEEDELPCLEWMVVPEVVGVAEVDDEELGGTLAVVERVELEFSVFVVDGPFASDSFGFLICWI